MRFGENFHNYLIPEWEEHYVDYHRLKRLVKSLADARFDSESDPGGWKMVPLRARHLHTQQSISH